MGKAIGVGLAAVFCAIAALLYQNMQQRRQLDEVVRQQEQIRHTLSEAQDSLSGASDKSSLLIRDDLHVFDSMRVAIAEYYASMGKMPATPAEVGLPAPEHYRGKTLKSAALQADGRIELVFDAKSGIDGGRVLFVPDTTHADAMGIQWHCETPDYALIARAAPTCEYKPPAGAIAPQSAVKTPAVGD